jgi:hypothetical protein
MRMSLRRPAGAAARRTVAALSGVTMSCIRVQSVFWLACAEGDDAPDGIIWRDPNGYSIARNHLDAKAAHSAAELGQHFVAGIALYAVKTAAVHRDHGALHVNEIILAQSASNPF